MKKFFTLFVIALAFAGSSAFAQSFTMEKDTVAITVYGTSTQYLYDSVAPATGSISLKWNVVSSNFPAEWLTMSSGNGICDNVLCYNVSSLWPSGAVRTSGSYTAVTGNHLFDMQFNPTSAATTTPGTYYMRVKLVNQAAMDSAYVVFAVTVPTPSSVGNTASRGEELQMYPNPASSELNFVYEGGSEIKTAAIYNIIGKTMAVYRVNGNSANMSLENMPAGIYILRLANAQGQLVATRKFTKQ